MERETHTDTKTEEQKKISHRQGEVRLLEHPVEVLVQPIEQEGQHLLGVLLGVAVELRGELGDGGLQGGWGHRAPAAEPQVLQNHSSTRAETRKDRHARVRVSKQVFRGGEGTVETHKNGMARHGQGISVPTAF